MRFTDTKFGILFASNGITGNTEISIDRNAARLIQRSYDMDRNICIVINADDLNGLKGGRSFWTMIRNKAYKVRFG